MANRPTLPPYEILKYASGEVVLGLGAFEKGFCQQKNN